jgi:2',3'-cyclic-nucleotide 2'-phosphodiesterase (5'-nucleotidase family)
MYYPKSKTVSLAGFAIPFVLFVLFTAFLYIPPLAFGAPVSFTILHTDDFHGQLEASGSNPGAARVAQN